jgi:histidine ammonia-lyase
MLTSEALREVIGILRTRVDSMGDDRYLATDLESAAQIVQDREILSGIGFDHLPALSYTGL